MTVKSILILIGACALIISSVAYHSVKNCFKFIGTLRAKKIETPKEFLANKDREIETTLFAFN